MTLRFASTQGLRAWPAFGLRRLEETVDRCELAVDAIIEQVKRCPSGALSYEQVKKAE